MQTPREKHIYKVTIVGFVVNVVLTIAKLLAGIIGHSGAMIADAVHSLSDFITDAVVLVFVKLSVKPRDDDHQYGHGKFETLATMIVGVALIVVGGGILWNSVQAIHDVIEGKIIPRPRLIAVIAAIISIVAKEWLFWYTFAVGKKQNSSVVVANAWHHRSDALSSIGTLVGITGAHFLSAHWRILDPIAAIIVSVFIFRIAIKLITPSVNELLEVSLSKDIENEILEIVTKNSEVQDPHNLKTRRIGNNIAIEVHIRVNKDMNVEQAHAITLDIESRIRERFGISTLIIVHVEPLKG